MSKNDKKKDSVNKKSAGESLKAKKPQAPAAKEAAKESAAQKKEPKKPAAAESTPQPKAKRKAAPKKKEQPKEGKPAYAGNGAKPEAAAAELKEISAEDKAAGKKAANAEDRAAAPQQSLEGKAEAEKTYQKESKKAAGKSKRIKKGLSKSVKSHLISENPVFIKALAIVPVLGAAVSLKAGILLSCAMILTVVLLNLAAYPINRYVPDRFRPAALFLAAGAVFTPVYILVGYFAPSVTASCGIYLPLVAVSALAMIETRHYGKRHGVGKTVLGAALEGLGFAFAAIIFAVIREVLGGGTLYGRPLPYVSGMKFSFALLPAGAFLLLGVLMALFRKICGAGGEEEGSK